MRLPCILVCLSLSVVILAGRTNYDDKKARQLLLVAAGAYGDETDTCLTPILHLNKTFEVLSETANCDNYGNRCAAFATTYPEKSELTVIFRGTKKEEQLCQEIKDVLFRETKDFFGMGQVLRYFHEAHRHMWPAIKSLLKNKKYADYKVVFTGHSLGGALAALAAARTAQTGLRSGKDITVYTFGEPRVGDYTFAKKFNSMISESYRVVHSKDIVPHTPFCKFLSLECRVPSGGPFHHGTEIWYPNSMEEGSEYKECLSEPYGEDPHCSNSLELIDLINVEDHTHYFGIEVSEYGKEKCTVEEKRKAKKGFWSELEEFFNNLFQAPSISCLLDP